MLSPLREAYTSGLMGCPYTLVRMFPSVGTERPQESASTRETMNKSPERPRGVGPGARGEGHELLCRIAYEVAVLSMVYTAPCRKDWFNRLQSPRRWPKLGGFCRYDAARMSFARMLRT